MRKKRPKPSEIAGTKPRNNSWYYGLDDEDRFWIDCIIEEIIQKKEKPSYYSIAARVIEILNLEAHENTIVRFLKKKVKQCHEKNQAK